MGKRFAEMVNLVTNIAEQINPWALFSTTYASRFGNIGKGFKAVSAKVASVSIQFPVSGIRAIARSI